MLGKNWSGIGRNFQEQQIECSTLKQKEEEEISFNDFFRSKRLITNEQQHDSKRYSTPNKKSYLSSWGVSVEDQMEKGNSVKHFQCLVCTRIHRNNKFKNMGRFGGRC